ncbi:hypothetical protein V6U77_05010 [Micromonospora sp. CPCC 205546]|uniref:hypothetical protein n=1 Tax=Micromonospora sp. CPCC 205546 TaxID=3122397 RepID=UPI002FF307B6
MPSTLRDGMIRSTVHATRTGPGEDRDDEDAPAVPVGLTVGLAGNRLRMAADDEQR